MGDNNKTNTNSKEPLYFVGIIIEYQPLHQAKRITLPKNSSRKNNPTKLDKGLYRIKYLDNDIDDMSPYEAFEACQLYNKVVNRNKHSSKKEKVFETSPKHSFDYWKYPN